MLIYQIPQIKRCALNCAPNLLTAYGQIVHALSMLRLDFVRDNVLKPQEIEALSARVLPLEPLL